MRFSSTVNASMSNVLQLTKANFQQTISKGTVLVDFWAEWCGPCKQIAPLLDQMATEHAGKVTIGKVNVDHNPEVSQTYGITSIPAILFLKGGQVVDKLVGAQPKANFVKKIEALK